MINLTDIKTPVVELINRTGKFIKEEKGKIIDKEVDVKSKNSFVTYVDKKAEQMLVEGLQKIIPNSSFLAEEGTGDQNESNYLWIIDPLDGTTNFINDIYPVSISVALQYKKKTVAGIVYEIGNDEMFAAFEGEEAKLNGNTISVSERNKLEDAFLATGFPYYDYEKLPGYLNALSEFMKTTTGLRRLGSAATDLAYVACGRFDGYFEYSLSPWDVAAGAFIVQQAGGYVQDFKGKDDYIYGKEIIATNPHLASEIQKIIADHLK
ncbi:MAG: inositol monophosphatase [Salinivirgaceae bacterium]|nr:MAG: inositol monophosphatase [Salinivirgaceae bacterium]